MSGKLPNLLNAARSLGEVERSHLSSIVITPGTLCYVARFVIHIYLPAPVDPDLPESVTFHAINHVPDIERELDWQTPARDQVLQLIRDPGLARPQEFGTMKAAQKTPFGQKPFGP